MTDIMGEGNWFEIATGNDSKVSNDKITANSGMGFVMVTWKDGFGVGFVANASPPKGPYEGIACDGSGGCFINFRTGDKTKDWGQPATYGAVKQDLRQRRGGAARPWEINGTGEVKMPNGTGKFKFVSEGEGFGVAKAKTYFHQLGDWTAPPNLFDPFWRAKLHPFERDELADVLNEVGDSKGSQVISGGQTAVEGDIN